MQILGHTSIFLLLSVSSAFFFHPQGFLTHQTAPATPPSKPLYGAKLAGKYMNLEEMEDNLTATTRLRLLSSGKVELMETDGPVFSSYIGTWALPDPTSFTMTISRTYTTGQPATESTDMGEFSYDLEREFSGTIEQVTSEIVNVDGSVNDEQERKVGYFNLIDTAFDFGEEEGGVGDRMGMGVMFS